MSRVLPRVVFLFIKGRVDSCKQSRRFNVSSLCETSCGKLCFLPVVTYIKYKITKNTRKLMFCSYLGEINCYWWICWFIIFGCKRVSFSYTKHKFVNFHHRAKSKDSKQRQLNYLKSCFFDFWFDVSARYGGILRATLKMPQTRSILKSIFTGGCAIMINQHNIDFWLSKPS